MDGRIQKCIIINKDNLDIIDRAFEKINPSDYVSHKITLHDLIETRKRVKEIREIVDEVEEVRVCWG